MKVRAYFNFHKKMYSIQKRTDKGWRVIDHVPYLTLENVSFHVSQKGRERVLREKRKNVHAYVRGDLREYGPTIRQPFRYNPYEAKYFYDLETKDFIHNAEWVFLAVDPNDHPYGYYQ